MNIAGYVASNIMEGELQYIQWPAVDEIVEAGGLLIDVRKPVETSI